MLRFAKIVGIMCALLGVFLILIFMPLWFWVVLVGIAFIILGIIITKLSC